MDDLEEIGDLERYIEASGAVLVFCSEGYCASKNCMREIRHAVATGRPLIALLEEAGRGSSDVAAFRAQLEAADVKYEQWGFEKSELLGGQLAAALFAKEPIEWNRLGVFQDVTLRLIAERLLPDGLGPTRVQGEVALCAEAHTAASSAKLAESHEEAMITGAEPTDVGLFDRFKSNALVAFGIRAKIAVGSEAMVESQRVYVSLHNQGALVLAGEAGIAATRELEELTACSHFLLYLDGRTWTSGERSETLGREVADAIKAGIPLVLAHEMPGVGQTCYAVPFASFFACADGATPAHLLKAGLYDTLAVPLKAGPWRAAGLALLVKALSSQERDELNKTEEASALTFMERVRTVDSHASQGQPPTVKKRLGGSSRRALVDPKPTTEISVSHASRQIIQSRAGLGNLKHLVESPPSHEMISGHVGTIERARAANMGHRKLGVLQMLRRSAGRQREYLLDRQSAGLPIENADSNTSEGELSAGMMSSKLMTAQV